MATTAKPGCIFRWLIDVRMSLQDVFLPESSELMTLLPEEARRAIIAYYFSKDRAMSLGSALMKHHAVYLSSGTPYREIVLSRDPQTKKPTYTPPSSASPALKFNVSHQAGLVAYIGSLGPNCRNVGIDVVCVNERNDIARILLSGDPQSGFGKWVDMHSEVFSMGELHDMKTWMPPPAVNGEDDVVLELRLRRFFAYWALKEAYIKLRGEALLAPWLKDIEFRNVKVPSSVADDVSTPQLRMGSRETEVWFRGQRVHDVVMELVPFQSRYMIATAVEVHLQSSKTTQEQELDAKYGDLFPEYQVLTPEVFLQSIERQNSKPG